MYNMIQIMISDDGSLLYIKQRKWMPKIIMVGKSRMGMSYALNNYVSKLYHSGYKVAILNDRFNKDWR